MKAVLLDTHAWAWTFTGSYRLSAGARKTIADSDTILISPVSFFEFAQKVRVGKWPTMSPMLDRLLGVIEKQGASVADLDPAVCLKAGSMTWTHRDPFDRLLAATAIVRNVLIVSADAVFDGVVARIW